LHAKRAIHEWQWVTRFKLRIQQSTLIAAICVTRCDIKFQRCRQTVHTEWHQKKIKRKIWVTALAFIYHYVQFEVSMRKHWSCRKILLFFCKGTYTIVLEFLCCSWVIWHPYVLFSQHVHTEWPSSPRMNNVPVRVMFPSSTPENSPSIITYSYNSELVYVKREESYEVYLPISLKWSPFTYLCKSSELSIMPRRPFRSSETLIVAW